MMTSPTRTRPALVGATVCACLLALCLFGSVASAQITEASKAAPATVIAGNTLTYNINILNGGATTNGVTVSDALPAGVVFISAMAPAGWSVFGNDAIVTFNKDVMAAGESASFTITVRVCSEVECNTVLANQVTVSSVNPPSTLIRSANTTVQSQSNLSITKAGSPNPIMAGNDITYTLNVSNAGPSNSAGTVVTDTLPAGWSVVSATTTLGSCSGMGTGTATCTLGVLGAANQCATSAPTSATVTVVAHVPAVSPAGTFTNTANVTSANCLPDSEPANNTALFETTVNVPNVGPGVPPPAGADLSDGKPGSVLFYAVYSSSAVEGGLNEENTRISITNIHPTMGVVVHLFVIDGNTCSAADTFVCLTANQTVALLASDVDPGVTGYVVAVAVDGPPGFADGHGTGCPISFNYLIGSAKVKLKVASSREADLQAESCASEFGSPVPGCEPNSTSAILRFNGMANGYNRLPRVLAVDSIASPADANNTLLVVDRIGGDLSVGGPFIGPLFGILFDDQENPYSFTTDVQACQLRRVFSNTFPRTT